MFHVSIPAGKGMDLPGFGAVQFSHSYRVDATSRSDAIAKARDRHNAEHPSVKIARGRITVEQEYAWHITFRNRADKRRRETSIVEATSERMAIRLASQIAWRKPGFRPEREPVKVEQR